MCLDSVQFRPNPSDTCKGTRCRWAEFLNYAYTYAAYNTIFSVVFMIAFVIVLPMSANYLFTQRWKKNTQIVQRSFPHMTNSVGLYSWASNIILWPINHRSHGKTRLEGRGFHEQANSAALCSKTLVTLLPPFQFAGWHRLCILIVIFDTQYFILIYYIYRMYIYIYVNEYIYNKYNIYII